MNDNPVPHFTIDGFILEFACVAHAELESARAAVVFVVRNWDAIVETERPNRQIKPQSDTHVVIEMIQMDVIIGATLDIAHIIESSQTNADSTLFVLLEDRDAVFGIAKPVGVAANRLAEARLTRADA